MTLGVLKRQLAQRLRQIARQMQAIEDEIAALIASDRELARKFAILTSIAGVSQVTAFALIIDMPEPGTLDGKKVASLAGLAPMTRQSGRWKGKAFITGGRAICARCCTCPPWSPPASIQISSKIRCASQSRKTRKGRHHRRHAKAHRARKRPDPR